MRILERLRRQEAISRTELAQQTGLGQATVSGIVRELLAHDLLRETRIPADTRGRPRLALRQNPDGLLIAGAFVLIGGRVDLQIGDMGGTVLARASAQSASPATTSDIVEAIASAYRAATAALPGRRPTAIGVSLPAMIDGTRGLVHWLPPHPPRTEPITQWLSEALGIPAFVDNVG
ncbi:MAG TPA: MarR family transcriptional regulator, partial [Novosphingobium sp.]|nr:MarR family transcriptional regulator [Novosphingobium sp.]